MHGFRLVRFLALLVLPLSVMACSSEKKAATGEVSGVVTSNGKPLPGGTITFTSAADNEKVARVGINKDGTYKVDNAPEGDCKITVEGPSKPSDSSQGSKAPMTISKKFLKPDTSGLTYTVKKGPQTFDVDLK